MFTVEAFQNRYLAPQTDRVDAILSITADQNTPETPVNRGLLLGFIVDNSGSMGGNRIRAVREAVGQAIYLLDERDSFFVVAFNSQAEVICPPQLATWESKAAAREAVERLNAEGGTAMSEGLSMARALFTRFPDAIHQAVFLTDGKNESEKPTAVTTELARCVGLFECDCWGVGTDWKVGEVQEIARGLLGKASLIPDAAHVEAAFRGAVEKAQSKSIKDVRVRLWTPMGAEVVFFKQVNPTIEDLTAKASVSSPQTREYLTGTWGNGEQRDYHVTIQVKPGQVGDEMLAGRPSMVYLRAEPTGWVEQEDKPAEARLFATWTADDALSSRLNQQVAHYTGQDELASAIQQGLQAREQGNETVATHLLGRAVQLAHSSGNEEMTARLKKVVDVVDAPSGTIKLKRQVAAAAEMDLQLESTTTRRLKRTATPVTEANEHAVS